jgi:hypothetical protein
MVFMTLMSVWKFFFCNFVVFSGGGGCADKCRWRLVFAILGCAGMAITYGLKVNLSVAIVAMVNQVSRILENEIFLWTTYYF